MNPIDNLFYQDMEEVSLEDMIVNDFGTMVDQIQEAEQYQTPATHLFEEASSKKKNYSLSDEDFDSLLSDSEGIDSILDNIE